MNNPYQEYRTNKIYTGENQMGYSTQTEYIGQDMVRQPSQVETQVAMLRDNLEILERTIAELSDRIRPVLNESAQIDPQTKEEVRTMSAVATAFWETNNRVFSATRSIQAILKRLEI
jgi:predicted  nucleic acid-binding Zn-ribbon protein